jgi:hypothetical protein
VLIGAPDPHERLGVWLLSRREKDGIILDVSHHWPIFKRR